MSDNTSNNPNTVNINESVRSDVGSTVAHESNNNCTLNSSGRNNTVVVAGGGGQVKDTELVAAIKANQNKESHKADLSSLEVDTGLSVYEDQLRRKLSKAIFVGHVNTDLDSVAGAMGAAALFGGTAAISEPLDTLNGEIVYALKNCGLEPPLQFDELHQRNGGKFKDDCPVCLVDHTEESQMVPSLREHYHDRVIGVIDHHALAKSFFTNRPIFMDLRPWGSMSTILGYLFVSHRRKLSKPLAVLLMQAILSDTLNLRSVTTTGADRSMVALLHSYAGIGNAATEFLHEVKQGLYEDTSIDYVAKKQFQAKTNWVVSMGPYEMVRGDQKDFTAGRWKFGIAVLEVTDTKQVMTCAGDILKELRLLKKEKALIKQDDDDEDDDSDDDSAILNDERDDVMMDRTLELDFAFLFVVNIVTEMSTLLICGGRELALAKAAFVENADINTEETPVKLHSACPGIEAPGSTIRPEETALTLPKGYVSRKAQFVPAFFKAIDDFEYDEKGPMSETQFSEEKQKEVAMNVQHQIDLSKGGGGTEPQRRMSSLRMSYRSNAMKTMIFTEEQIDDELISVNKRNINKHHGNLYDSNGRVMRIYS